jgi:hypothetical protein
MSVTIFVSCKIILDTARVLPHYHSMSDTATEERRDVEADEEQLRLREIIEGRESFQSAFDGWVRDMEKTYGGNSCFPLTLGRRPHD